MPTMMSVDTKLVRDSNNSKLVHELADEVERLRERERELCDVIQLQHVPLLAAAKEASEYLQMSDDNPMEKQAAIELDRRVAACEVKS